MIRRFNLHWLEWLVVIVVLVLIFFAVAGNSGAALWMKQALHWAGSGVSLLANGIDKLINSAGK